MLNRLAATVAVALVLAFVGGCQSEGQKQVSHGERFPAADVPRSVHKMADAQVASGARADSTLHGQHFDGAQLNSLGRQKLRYMMKDDDACEPLVVYLDARGPANLADGRRDATLAFLLDQGLLETQVQLKDGPSPASASPASRGVKALAGPDADKGGAIVLEMPATGAKAGK